jgi:hypothetical protein
LITETIHPIKYLIKYIKYPIKNIPQNKNSFTDQFSFKEYLFGFIAPKTYLALQSIDFERA